MVWSLIHTENEEFSIEIILELNCVWGFEKTSELLPKKEEITW